MQDSKLWLIDTDSHDFVFNRRENNLWPSNIFKMIFPVSHDSKWVVVILKKLGKFENEFLPLTVQFYSKMFEWSCAQFYSRVGHSLSKVFRLNCSFFTKKSKFALLLFLKEWIPLITFFKRVKRATNLKVPWRFFHPNCYDSERKISDLLLK